jgi:hypothetical protein
MEQNVPELFGRPNPWSTQRSGRGEFWARALWHGLRVVEMEGYSRSYLACTIGYLDPSCWPCIGSYVGKWWVWSSMEDSGAMWFSEPETITELTCMAAK